MKQIMLSKKHENSLDAAITEMKELKKEITRKAISDFAMSQVLRGTHIGARLSTITVKQISLYCEKHKIS